MKHCRADYKEWEQRTTCVACAHPLADNQLVKDAYTLNTTAAWAKGQLTILHDMAKDRGLDWFADQSQKIADRIQLLGDLADEPPWNQDAEEENASGTIPDTEEAWEKGELGADANFVAVAEDVDQSAIDAALELQPISIRLHKSLIEDFKMIAKLNGMGYQPLMRQVLARFADCEKKHPEDTPESDPRAPPWDDEDD